MKTIRYHLKTSTCFIITGAYICLHRRALRPVFIQFFMLLPKEEQREQTKTN